MNQNIYAMSFPLGTLKSHQPGSPVDPGCLLCDGITQHKIIQYQALYDKYCSTPTVLTPTAKQTHFILTGQVDPSTGTYYQITAQETKYIVPETTTNMMQVTGITSEKIQVDLTPLLCSGLQNNLQELHIEDIIPMLFAGKPLQLVYAESWQVKNNTLIGNLCNISPDLKYVLRIYRPEILAYYKEAYQPTDLVNFKSSSPITSAALANYLANVSSSAPLILGNATVGSMIKLFGTIAPQPGSVFTEITTVGKILVKASDERIAVIVDNETGLISTPLIDPENRGT